MTQHAEWSPKEIERLRNAFLNGEKIKLVARELGRTHTALNKALSRFGIRAQKARPIVLQKNHLGYISISSNLKSSNLVVHKNTTSQESTTPHTPRPKFIDFLATRRKVAKDNQKWVSIEKVADYLSKQGFCITPVSSDNSQAQPINFLINNKPVSTAKLVFIANRIRLEERKPIFYVSEVTW